MQEEITLQNAQLNQEIETIYKNPPQVGHEYAHLYMHLPDLLSKSQAFKRTWQRRVRQAATKEKIRRRREWEEASRSAREMAMRRTR